MKNIIFARHMNPKYGGTEVIRNTQNLISTLGDTAEVVESMTVSGWFHQLIFSYLRHESKPVIGENALRNKLADTLDSETLLILCGGHIQACLAGAIDMIYEEVIRKEITDITLLTTSALLYNIGHARRDRDHLITDVIDWSSKSYGVRTKINQILNGEAVEQDVVGDVEGQLVGSLLIAGSLQDLIEVVRK